jgi:purine-nucleoside phosphorylase
VSRRAASRRAHIDEAAALIRRRAGGPAGIGIVLGSGLGALADAVAADASIPYEEIPHFPVPGVAGHAGRLIIGRLADARVAVLQGRPHLYEGYSAAQVAFPVRVLARLGVRTLILTNAAGGASQGVRAGDLMLITDHINFTGANPLTGPNDETLGPRFPSLWRAYDPELAALAFEAAREEGIELETGIYAGVAGPSYETPAEMAMLERWGADAVGMSTVTEVIAARHAGLRVLGLCAITNAASGEPASHERVLEAAGRVAPVLGRLVRRIVRRLASGEETETGPPG